MNSVQIIDSHHTKYVLKTFLILEVYGPSCGGGRGWGEEDEVVGVGSVSVFGESGLWRVWDVGRRGGAWRERRKLWLRFLETGW